MAAENWFGHKAAVRLHLLVQCMSEGIMGLLLQDSQEGDNRIAPIFMKENNLSLFCQCFFIVHLNSLIDQSCVMLCNYEVI